MSNVKILIFDEEELTKTLLESFLNELSFSYSVEKFNEFSEFLIQDIKEDKIIIVNINKLNLGILKSISVLSSDKKNNFIVISYDNSTDLHVQALRAGAKDFLLKPLVKNNFIYSVRKIYQNDILKQHHSHLAKVYTASSKEKGQGKSLFLINLAKELADMSGEKVLLIDFNNSIDDISFLLNIEIVYNANYYFNNIKKENADKLLSYLPRYGNSSLYVMANGFVQKENDKLNLFRFDEALVLLKQKFKYIFIDRDIADEKINDNVIRMSDIVFYLMPPIQSGIEKVQSDLGIFYKNKRVRLIINKYENKDEQKIQQIKEELRREVFAKIPKNFMAMGLAINNKKTLKEVKPNLDIVKAYSKIAKFIINRD